MWGWGGGQLVEMEGLFVNSLSYWDCQKVTMDGRPTWLLCLNQKMESNWVIVENGQFDDWSKTSHFLGNKKQSTVKASGPYLSPECCWLLPKYSPSCLLERLWMCVSKWGDVSLQPDTGLKDWRRPPIRLVPLPAVLPSSDETSLIRQGNQC